MALSIPWTSQVALVVKYMPANAGDISDVGSVPGSGRSPGGGHGNPLLYSCLENPMNRRAWWATVHRIKMSRIGLIIAFCAACTSCLHFNLIANASKKRMIIIGLSDTW